jgi:hypothetical protein
LYTHSSSIVSIVVTGDGAGWVVEVSRAVRDSRVHKVICEGPAVACPYGITPVGSHMIQDYIHIDPKKQEFLSQDEEATD